MMARSARGEGGARKEEEEGEGEGTGWVVRALAEGARGVETDWGMKEEEEEEPVCSGEERGETSVLHCDFYEEKKQERVHTSSLISLAYSMAISPPSWTLFRMRALSTTETIVSLPHLERRKGRWMMK
jgi:hypothetical protein